MMMMVVDYFIYSSSINSYDIYAAGLGNKKPSSNSVLLTGNTEERKKARRYFRCLLHLVAGLGGGGVFYYSSHRWLFLIGGGGGGGEEPNTVTVLSPIGILINGSQTNVLVKKWLCTLINISIIKNACVILSLCSILYIANCVPFRPVRYFLCSVRTYVRCHTA